MGSSISAVPFEVEGVGVSVALQIIGNPGDAAAVTAEASENHAYLSLDPPMSTVKARHASIRKAS